MYSRALWSRNEEAYGPGVMPHNVGAPHAHWHIGNDDKPIGSRNFWQ